MIARRGTRTRTIVSIAALVVVAASGFLVAGTFPNAADAWDWHNLPNGYGARVDQISHACEIVVLTGKTTGATVTFDSCNGPLLFGTAMSNFKAANPDGVVTVSDTMQGQNCDDVTVNGHDVGSDCDPGFQAAVDAYVNSTICTVNAAADPARCTPTTTLAKTTTTTTAATTVATTTTVAATTTAQQPAPAAAVTIQAQTVTVTTPTYTATVTTPTYTVQANVSDEFDLINQRLAVLEGRVQALEDQVGLILGEEKNEAPFTNPA